MSSLPYPTPPTAADPPSARTASDAGAVRAGGLHESRHTLQFTGSGSEYLRIWIVNLLLTLVTFGIYYPWAKARKLRYFRGNTRLAGHAFDFHGDPKRMLRGYLLMAVLFVAYSAAQKISPLASAVALLLVAAIWPALFRAGLRFRLANTSWRGLRFRFVGSTGGAYRVMLTVLLPAVVVVTLVALSALPTFRSDPGVIGPLLALLALLGFFSLMPYFFWLVKRYQHDHYAFASLRTHFEAKPRSFYGLSMKTSGVMVLAVIGFGVFAGVGAWAAGGSRALFGIAAGIGGYAVFFALVQPFVVSRTQNLVWSGTNAGPQLRFESALRYWPLVGLTLLNLVLVACTLGLYWPFAAVAVARMRLQAVSVLTSLDLDEFTDLVRERHDDAVGDAAGDIFDIDIGL